MNVADLTDAELLKRSNEQPCAWRAHRPDKPSRPEAIRQLAEKGLKGQ